MAWLRELSASTGEVWFKPCQEEGLYNVEGILELEEPLLVWFQDIDRSIELTDPVSSGKYRVRKGRIALEPRLEPQVAEPKDFLDLCQRLLAPKQERGEEWYGYVFSANLPLETGENLTVRFRDTTFWGREGTFVEFVRREPPYILVAQDRATTLATKPEEFEPMLRLKARWPVERESPGSAPGV
jgi:hypothetical protein